MYLLLPCQATTLKFGFHCLLGNTKLKKMLFLLPPRPYSLRLVVRRTAPVPVSRQARCRPANHYIRENRKHERGDQQDWDVGPEHGAGYPPECLVKNFTRRWETYPPGGVNSTRKSRKCNGVGRRRNRPPRARGRQYIEARLPALPARFPPSRPTSACRSSPIAGSAAWPPNTG